MTLPRRAALVVALALVVVSALAVPAGARRAQDDQPPAPTAPAPTIELVSRAPWIGPDETVTFAVRVDGPVEGTEVRVRVHEALDTVADLEASTTEDTGRVVFRTPPLAVSFLGVDTDGTTLVGLRSATDPAGDPFTTSLTEPGVHPVVITLLAAGEVVDEIRTPLVALGSPEDSPDDRPGLAVVLDVATAPTLAPDGTRALPDGALDDLAPVADLLATVGADLTVRAVPDTVDALALADDPVADALLAALADHRLLDHPYLPIDVDALVVEDLVAQVPIARARGRAVLTDRSARPLVEGVWDAGAALTSRSTALLADVGIDRILVEATADDLLGADDPDDDDIGSDDDAPAPVLAPGPRPVVGAGALQGLVADAAYAAELAGPLDAAPDAVHLVLADLLLRPREGRDVLVRPTVLAPGSALAALVGLLDDPAAPVVAGGLDVLDRPTGPSDPDDPEPDPDDPADPLPAVVWAGAPHADLAPIANDVADLLDDLDAFDRLVDVDSARPDDLRLRVLTALARTTPDADRGAYTDAVADGLAGTFAALRLGGQTALNLSSRRGTLPVTVANGNPFPVNVRIRIRSDRLAFPEGDVLDVRVPGEVERVDIPVEALATGSVPVFVELWTLDDARLLDSRRLDVRSTAISGVGLAISIGALVVLATWWFRSWRRGRRPDA